MSNASAEPTIAENLDEVRARIAAACARAGRAPAAVRLLAVSKNKPIALVREALAAGQALFGENYVQELVEKASLIPHAEWHFIGSLQTNKVKQVVGRAKLIHSVDREKLVRELAKAAAGLGVVQDVLLQVHVGGEVTKSGVTTAQVPVLLEAIRASKSLRLRGLMALPPLSDSESIARGYFAEVRSAFDRWRSAMPANEAAAFSELSLGTSSDYEWAILEGATLVRVGTAIFGAREA